MSALLDPAHISREVRAEAAAWLARLRADDRSIADEHAFQAWLAADCTHAAAFESVNAIWEASAGFPRDLRGGMPKAEFATGRRALLAGLGGLIVAGGSVGFWQSAQANVYQTDVGELKHVLLKDGTEVFLDTNTRLTVNFSTAGRLVNLEYGRANFRVAPEVKRLFTVRVADRSVVARHSTFDVRRDGDRVSVVVIHGQVSVESPRRPAAIVSDGQQGIAMSGQTVKVNAANLISLLAWQSGQAIFESESLSQAAYEMNRYSTVKLEVDPAIANLKVSGVYQVGESSTFAQSISLLLPVQARWQGDDRIELVARNLQG